jgi:putative OPT family oligopeptide transporter
MATEHVQEVTKVLAPGSLPDEGGHRPYVPDVVTMPEFTWSAVLVGAVLGIIFGASSLYLVLKVGMTVSASIPVAVLSITLFRWAARTFGIRKATILENNIVQTTGSAGESIAFGVGVTMPALMLIGFEMEWTRVLVVAVLGGLLGILMMIPLRRAFIVKLHGKPGEPGKLLYPEGTACAQVLISGEKGGTSGKTVFIGFGIAFAHKFLTEGMSLLTTTCVLPLKLGQKATDAFSRVAKVTGDMASELLGVGYIIGMRTSAVMMAGAVLGGLVLTPALAVGSDMSTSDIYKEYLRYIGAGCVAAAGIISMGRTLPMIVRSFSSGLSSLRGGGPVEARTRRVDDDMQPKMVLGGSLLLLGLLAVFLKVSDDEVTIVTALLGAILVVVFGFLFVTVSSRLTGEIGSSSNPISGMTVATLLLTCLIFLGLGMVRPTDAVLALSIGGVVCIAASNGGTTSQDLKTGYLVGGTPRWQQWAILVGAITSAIVIGGTLLLFNSVGTVYSQRNLPPVDLKPELDKIRETEIYKDETFKVWRPAGGEKLPDVREHGKFVELQQAVAATAVLGITVPDAKETEVEVKPGKYLVDQQGQVCYKVDPTITGEVDQRDELVQAPAEVANVKLSDKELERVKHTIAHRGDKGQQSSSPQKHYRLWTNDKGNLEKEKDAEKDEDKQKIEPYRSDVPEGLYAVDSEGRIVYKVEGTKVAMKFKAPKTQVMGIIINGLLNSKLNWALVLIGACIAITLELCGISSLAFAVGVYIPMQYSTPIFLGGIVRWLVDNASARQARAEAAALEHADEATRAEAEVRAIAKSETSSGMLLASGLIAGGSLAGVLIAFLNFIPAIQKAMDFAGPMDALFGGKEDEPSAAQQIIALVVFSGLAAVLLLAGLGKIFQAPPEEETPPPPGGLPPTQDADYHIRPT